MSSFLSTHLDEQMGIYVATEYGQFCPLIWANKLVFMWLQIMISFLSTHLGIQMGIYVATDYGQFLSTHLGEQMVFMWLQITISFNILEIYLISLIRFSVSWLKFVFWGYF